MAVVEHALIPRAVWNSPVARLRATGEFLSWALSHQQAALMRASCIPFAYGQVSYHRHRFPGIVIQQAVWLYFPYGQNIEPKLRSIRSKNWTAIVRSFIALPMFAEARCEDDQLVRL